MALATRCPHCSTVFRLVPDQLKLRHGLVRCGHCREVFDGALHSCEPPAPPDRVAPEPRASAPEETAVTASDAWAAATPPPTEPAAEVAAEPLLTADDALVTDAADVDATIEAAPATDTAPAMRDDAEDLADVPAPPFRQDPSPIAAPAETPAAPVLGDLAARARGLVDAEPETPAEPAADDRGMHAPAAAVPPPAAPRPAAVGESPMPAADTRIEPALNFSTAVSPHMQPPTATPAFPPLVSTGATDNFRIDVETPAPDAPRGRAARCVGGTVAALALLALLGVQVAWWQREPITIRWPATLPLYRQACASLGCAVPPLHDSDSLEIEQSALRQVNGPRDLELTMSLRNHALTPLAYPDIELTLLDKNNQVAIRRVIRPEDYLQNPSRAADGMAGRARQAIRVRLTTPGGPEAANFRVLAFYP